MPADLPVVIAMLVQAASGAPAAAPPPQPSHSTQPVNEACPSEPPKANQRDIVICAPRPQGYRLNPDVMEARREVKSGGRPTRPGGTVDDSCKVGPRPCVGAGINLVAAAITAATMAEKAVKGENVGEMFVTDPHPSEYQLYQMAKKRREAHEAEIKAEAQAKARTAATVDPSEDSKSATPQPH